MVEKFDFCMFDFFRLFILIYVCFSGLFVFFWRLRSGFGLGFGVLFFVVVCFFCINIRSVLF